MTIYSKTENDFQGNEVTVGNTKYIPDFVIRFPVNKDTIDIDNCICVFSILNRNNLYFRQYVGAEFFKNLNNENIEKSINGYLPETVFCFSKTKFPLEEFIEEMDFQPFFKIN